MKNPPCLNSPLYSPALYESWLIGPAPTSMVLIGVVCGSGSWATAAPGNAATAIATSVPRTTALQAGAASPFACVFMTAAL
jgi:hypothetical protein